MRKIRAFSTKRNVAPAEMRAKRTMSPVPAEALVEMRERRAFPDSSARSSSKWPPNPANSSDRRPPNPERSSDRRPPDPERSSDRLPPNPANPSGKRQRAEPRGAALGAPLPCGRPAPGALRARRRPMAVGAGFARRRSCCGGRRCAPTSLRCSPRGRAAELAARASLAPLEQTAASQRYEARSARRPRGCAARRRRGRAAGRPAAAPSGLWQGRRAVAWRARPGVPMRRVRPPCRRLPLDRRAYAKRMLCRFDERRALPRTDAGRTARFTRILGYVTSRALEIARSSRILAGGVVGADGNARISRVVAVGRRPARAAVPGSCRQAPDSRWQTGLGLADAATVGPTRVHVGRRYFRVALALIARTQSVAENPGARSAVRPQSFKRSTRST